MYYYETESAERKTDKKELSFFVAVILAWLLPGLFGHGPWKPDEAYNFGLTWHLLQKGDWVFLHLTDDAPLTMAPLFYVTAAFFGKLFSPLLSLPDAFRLTTGFYITLCLVFLGLSAGKLYDKAMLAVLIFIGSFGLLAHAHQLVADSALLAGCAIALYGLVLEKERISAGMFFGTGIGIGFMSKGAIAIFLFTPLLVLLPLASANWRKKRSLYFLLTALVFLAPWLLFWPYFLHERSLPLFHAWLQNTLRLGFNPLFYLGVLPWFAWPALPLSLYALKKESFSTLLLPLLVFISMFAGLSLYFEAPRELWALPLLLPLSLLAVSYAEKLKRSYVSAFNWFGIVTFGLTGAVFWAGWLAMITGSPEFIAKKIHHFHPDFAAGFNLFPFLIAAGITLAWLYFVLRGGKKSGKQAVVNWALGIAMVWAILMTVWLPFVDSIKSYQDTFKTLSAQLPRDYRCLESRGLGDPQRAMLEYYAGIITQRNSKQICDYLLVQTFSSDRKDPEGWKRIWEGARPGDRHERYRLYKK